MRSQFVVGGVLVTLVSLMSCSKIPEDPGELVNSGGIEPNPALQVKPESLLGKWKGTAKLQSELLLHFSNLPFGDVECKTFEANLVPVSAGGVPVYHFKVGASCADTLGVDRSFVAKEILVFQTFSKERTLVRRGVDRPWSVREEVFAELQGGKITINPYYVDRNGNRDESRVLGLKLFSYVKDWWTTVVMDSFYTGSITMLGPDLVRVTMEIRIEIPVLGGFTFASAEAELERVK